VSRIQKRTKRIEASLKGYSIFIADTVFIVTQGGVSHNLLFSLKSSVVDVKSEAQTKRVYHALHEKTTCQRCEYKSSSRRVEGKQVCLYGFSLKLIAGNRLNPLLNRS